jgi:basic amino acid/polyamine antiporter, APA family
MALEHAMPNSNLAVGIVAFGSVIAHTAVLLAFQLGQPRIFFPMARDGLLPKVFYKVHPKYRTPHISTILTGLFVGVFAAVASIDEMVDLTNIGTLFAFILVCAGIIILRVKDPGRHRPFRVPGGLVIPILGDPLVPVFNLLPAADLLAQVRRLVEFWLCDLCRLWLRKEPAHRQRAGHECGAA